MWPVPVSGDSYFTFQLNTGPGSCWQLLGRLRFRTWAQRNEREGFIPQQKNKAENNLKLGTPFRKETLEGMVSVVTFHRQFPRLKNQWEYLQFKSSQGYCWQTCTDSSKQQAPEAENPVNPGRQHFESFGIWFSSKEIWDFVDTSQSGVWVSVNRANRLQGLLSA